MADALEELIHRADLDALVRHVDNTCSQRDWDHLIQIRNQSRAAVNTGRQLWPIATLANYRLALWAPPEHAVRSLDDTARTFMPGPVSEILAVNHSWDDVSPFLHPGHDRSLIAYERSLRRDHIEHNEPQLLDIPFDLQDWEPNYCLATYTDDGVDSPAPQFPLQWEVVQSVTSSSIEDDTVNVFRTVMEPWTAHSNGTAMAAVVEGGLEEALGQLGTTRNECASLSPSDALMGLAWASAHGGAHGKRKGGATGRSDAWWLLATFAGLSDDWPCDPDDLGDVVQMLECFTFRNENSASNGWNISLVLVDPEEGLSVLLQAHDYL